MPEKCPYPGIIMNDSAEFSTIVSILHAEYVAHKRAYPLP